MLANLGWVDFDFESSTVCPILPGLMGIWQKLLGKYTRLWNAEIQANPTQVREQMVHTPRTSKQRDILFFLS